MVRQGCALRVQEQGGWPAWLEPSVVLEKPAWLVEEGIRSLPAAGRRAES